MSSGGPVKAPEHVVLEPNSPTLMASPKGQFVTTPRAGNIRFQEGNPFVAPAHANRRKRSTKCTIM